MSTQGKEENAALIRAAQQLKDEGNELFKAQMYRKAAIVYNKVFGYVNGLVAEGHEMGQYAQAGSMLDEETAAEVRKLKLATYGNLCAAYVHLSKYEKVIKFADRALKLDPNYVKCLFRKGQALTKLRKYDDAKTVLRAAVDIDNNNRAVRDAYKENARLRKEWLKGEKEKARASFGGKLL